MGCGSSCVPLWVEFNVHNPEVFVKRCWSRDELELHWGLLPPESSLLRNKSGATRLGFSLLLKFFQLEGRFPGAAHEMPDQAVAFLAEQAQDRLRGQGARFGANRPGNSDEAGHPIRLKPAGQFG